MCPTEESKVVKSDSLIKILHHFLDKKEGANNNKHEGKRSHRQVKWSRKQWSQIWLERAGDHISAKKEKVGFSAAFVLHSIGNNKYLPCSRHMLDPGDAQVRKRDPSPFWTTQKWQNQWPKRNDVQVSRAVGTTHPGCKGRPTQVLSSDYLSHDPSGSKEAEPAATQPAPLPEPLILSWKPTVPVAPAPSSGVHHTQDSLSFSTRSLSFCY